MFFTETKRISDIVAKGANETLSEKDMIAEIIKEWTFSPERLDMLDGKRYYCNQNDILLRKRMVIGEDGSLVEDKSLMNNRISHAFLRKLVDQKSQYLFGKPFSIRTETSDYGDLLNEIFDETLRKKIKNLCKEAVNKGVAWLQPYIDEEGVHFKKIPAEELIPLWEDAEHTTLQAAIRVYNMEEFEGRHKKIITHVEYWNLNGVQFYLLENGKLEPDPFHPDGDHMMINGKAYNFTKVPFIPFRYNEEELPLIRFVKSLLDDYDLLKSDDTNTIMDTPNSILVVKNYEGQNLGEFRKNLAQYKAVKVTDDGGLDIKSMGLNTDSIQLHLQQDRKDIYEAGRGVDTQSENFGAASGVALKFLYADLDLDCNGIESEFMGAFSEMRFYIDLYFQLIGKGNFSDQRVSFILNRDIIINETQAIDDCRKSEGLISPKTILENHPWVVDVREEMSAEGH